MRQPPTIYLSEMSKAKHKKLYSMVRNQLLRNLSESSSINRGSKFRIGYRVDSSYSRNVYSGSAESELAGKEAMKGGSYGRVTLWRWRSPQWCQACGVAQNPWLKKGLGLWKMSCVCECMHMYTCAYIHTCTYKIFPTYCLQSRILTSETTI